MSNVEEEITYRGVRKRKWGKYVAEIRSRKRSRISLGSYFTPDAAARAYDTALFCLRGAHVTTFNFPDSQFNSTALQIANNNPSPCAIRRAAIAVATAFDKIPSNQAGEADNYNQEHALVEEIKVDEEEHMTTGLNALLQSPEHKTIEEIIPMPLFHPHDRDMMQLDDHDCPELFPQLATCASCWGKLFPR